MSDSNEQEPKKTISDHLFGEDKLSIDCYKPNMKAIFRTLGLPENYMEAIDPNAE